MGARARFPMTPFSACAASNAVSMSFSSSALPSVSKYSLEMAIEIILKKISPALYTALGVFLPLITTNCCVLGVSLKVVGEGFQYGNNVGEAVIYAAGIAIGFAVALIIFSGIREHLDLMEMPKGMKGTPIALITAGILAMAFMGFGGLVK